VVVAEVLERRMVATAIAWAVEVEWHGGVR
jgi:hypothetical protein